MGGVNGLLVVIDDGTGTLVPEQQLDDPVQGDLAYFDGSEWQRLAPGTSGQYLKTQGAAANPVWDSVNEPGVNVYPPSAADPVSPAPSNGDLYYNTTLRLWLYYDSVRTKWLSVETCEIMFGRRNNTGAGAYYRMIDGLSFSSAYGRRAAFNGTVVSMSYTRDDSDSATFDVMANGVLVPSASLGSSVTAGTATTLNGDFSAGDILGVMNRAGGNATRRVMGYVRFKWRA